MMATIKMTLPLLRPPAAVAAAGKLRPMEAS
jgi:hypothetical protein